MPKDRRKTPSPPAGLSDEDAELWSRVAKTAQPLEKGRDRAIGPAQSVSDKPSKPASVKPAAEPPGRVPAPVKSPGEKTPPPIAPIDRRDKRQLGTGRLSVDARLDLHG
ncbi:MAG: Smr/MutS family protein, partial [Methyloligellaceae bacterium]